MTVLSGAGLTGIGLHATGGVEQKRAEKEGSLFVSSVGLIPRSPCLLHEKITNKDMEREREDDTHSTRAALFFIVHSFGRKVETD